MGCTSASFGRGVEYEKELRRRMERASGGVPVVTSNQAMLWSALKVLDCGARVDGFGKLFSLR